MINRDEYMLEMERLEAATAWLMLLRDAPGEADMLGWVQWCELDPRNLAAFERMQDLWLLSSALEPEVRGGELQHTATPAVRCQPARHGGKPIASSPRWRLGAAIAASVAMLTIAAWFGTMRFPGGLGNGEIIADNVPVSTQRLQDGSRMELAPRSEVHVGYTEARRGLELKHGEAYFDVAPNPERPFVVQAGPVRIRAVGTAFNVRHAGGRIVVTVTEGQVDVHMPLPAPANGGAASGPVRVISGEQLRWSPEAARPHARQVHVDDALAWRQGRLEYRDEPLASVVADLNRYTKGRVVVHGSEARELRFSGTILTRAADQWLDGLPDIFPVRVRHENGVDIVLSDPASPPEGLQ